MILHGRVFVMSVLAFIANLLRVYDEDSLSKGVCNMTQSLSFECFHCFKGWIWVLIASVPGLCILLTFIRNWHLYFYSVEGCQHA